MGDAEAKEGRGRKRGRWWVLVVLGIGGCAAYPPLKIRWAARQTATLCADMKPGTAVGAFKPRAEALGLRASVMPVAKDGRQRLMAYEGWVFARHFCHAVARDGAITEASVSSLD